MKTKRMIGLLLSIMMILNCLTCCQAEPAVRTTPSSTVDSSQSSMSEQPQNPSDKTSFDGALASARIVVDGIVHNFDIQTSDGAWYISAADAQTIFGSAFAGDYVALDDYARSADIHYTQDEALSAAYFSTWEPYTATASLAGFESYAEELNLPLDKLGQETVSGAEMAELLDCFVAHDAPEQIDAWDDISAKLRASHDPLCRSDALAALFLAAWNIGGNYMVYEKESTMEMRDAAFDKSDDRRNWDLFSSMPIPGEFDVGYGAVDHYGAGSCIFNLGTVSPVDASHPFSYDGTSFRHDENVTYIEAVVSILRVFSTKSSQIVTVEDPAATALSGVFTEELLAKATAPSTVSAENHPQWTGFVLNGELDWNLKDVPDNMVHCANWGFNSARLNLAYEQIFNRDVTEVDLAMMNVLDQIVVQAVQNNMHLNICMTSLPGRWKAASGDYEEFGEFDLFLNDEKQQQANRIFEILTERYKGFSSNYLSFTPVWEPMNHNLSSGLPFEDYTYDDYAKSISEFVDVIQGIDSERLIIVEPTMLTNAVAIAQDSKSIYAALADKANIIYSYNFVEAPFVYTCMTAESGRNIDDENRSYYLAEYPAYYYDLDNCIVDPKMESLRDALPEGNFDGSSSLLIDGCLPVGTTIELHLRQTYGGQLQFIADGEIIYTEDIGHNFYNVEETVSGYINYAVSDKIISVTLENNVTMLEIATPGGALIWTAMDMHLPEEYARERWYYATPYDVFCGLEEQAGIMLKNEARVMVWPYDLYDKEHKENRLTINDDLTYCTPTVRESSSKETISTMMQTINETQPGSIIRYERALFNGGIKDEILEYYADMYTALNERGIGWWSNDWWVMTNDMSENIADARQTSYSHFARFDLELLKLMQQYQNSERP